MSGLQLPRRFRNIEVAVCSRNGRKRSFRFRLDSFAESAHPRTRIENGFHFQVRGPGLGRPGPESWRSHEHAGSPRLLPRLSGVRTDRPGRALFGLQRGVAAPRPDHDAAGFRGARVAVVHARAGAHRAARSGSPHRSQRGPRSAHHALSAFLTATWRKRRLNPPSREWLGGFRCAPLHSAIRAGRSRERPNRQTVPRRRTETPPSTRSSRSRS